MSARPENQPALHRMDTPGIRVKFKRDGRWTENRHRIAAEVLFRFFVSWCKGTRISTAIGIEEKQVLNNRNKIKIATFTR